MSQERKDCGKRKIVISDHNELLQIFSQDNRKEEKLDFFQALKKVSVKICITQCNLDIVNSLPVIIHLRLLTNATFRTEKFVPPFVSSSNH